MGLRVHLATLADRDTLLVADVFEAPPRADYLDSFLNDPRHHLAMAEQDGHCIGFASAVHYVHPDKAPQLWINELGVNATYRRRGIATQLIEATLDHAKTLHCSEAWVLADPTDAALGFYTSLNATREGDHLAMFTFHLSEDH